MYQDHDDDEDEICPQCGEIHPDISIAGEHVPFEPRLLQPCPCVFVVMKSLKGPWITTWVNGVTEEFTPPCVLMWN